MPEAGLCRSTSCSIGVCTNFVLNAHCCCWIAYTRKHNFSNAQTIGRVLVRIFPVRRWIARICKRHAFGRKFQSKSESTASRQASKCSEHSPLPCCFRQAVNAAAIANIGQRRDCRSLLQRPLLTPLPYRFQPLIFLHPRKQERSPYQ